MTYCLIVSLYQSSFFDVTYIKIRYKIAKPIHVDVKYVLSKHFIVTKKKLINYFLECDFFFVVGFFAGKMQQQFSFCPMSRLAFSGHDPRPCGFLCLLYVFDQ